jgi:hypothetical protein
VERQRGGRPLTLNIGADVARQKEHRQGFVNNFGVVGDLRRDEDDTVTGTDAYAEAQWYLMDKLSFTLGVRSSKVHYNSDDHYITPANPNDSGNRTYYNTSPIAGVLWSAADNLNAYFSFGQGFETPTFAELAYNPSGPGLNFNLLPATSTAYELGLKWLPQPTQRVNLAVFTAKTKDEIVVNTATGGRTTYANAGKTRRRGVEAEWDAQLPGGFTAHANYTYLLAEFADPYTSGTPPVIIPAGSKLPGVPPQQFYGVLNWAPGGWAGFNVSGEVQYVAKIYANDRNTAAAPAVHHRQRAGGLRADRRQGEDHRVCAAQQHRRQEIRRLGDRRRHQRSLLRARRPGATGSSARPSRSPFERRLRERSAVNRPRELRGRWGFVDRRERQLDVEGSLQPPDDARRGERVAAQLEEVVVNADVVDREHSDHSSSSAFSIGVDGGRMQSRAAAALATARGGRSGRSCRSGSAASRRGKQRPRESCAREARARGCGGGGSRSPEAMTRDEIRDQPPLALLVLAGDRCRVLHAAHRVQRDLDFGQVDAKPRTLTCESRRPTCVRHPFAARTPRSPVR